MRCAISIRADRKSIPGRLRRGPSRSHGGRAVKVSEEAARDPGGVCSGGEVVATEVVIGPALLESAWAITRIERATATILSPLARSTRVMGMHMGVLAAAADQRGPRSPRCGCWLPLPCVKDATTAVAPVGRGPAPTRRGVHSGAGERSRDHDRGRLADVLDRARTSSSSRACPARAATEVTRDLDS
jgi:hypothetical protein